MKIMKQVQTRVVTHDDLENLEQQIKKFVKIDEYNDLVRDVADCATK